MSQSDNAAHKGPYTDCRNAHNYDGATDKVMEPLTRLFTDLVTQLTLLTPSGQGGDPNYDAKIRNGLQTGSSNGHRWHTNGHYHKREEPNNRSSFRHNGHHWGNKDGHKSNFSRRPHTRINEVKSNSECDSECLTMSNIEEHLEEEVEPVPTSPKN